MNLRISKETSFTVLITGVTCPNCKQSITPTSNNCLCDIAGYQDSESTDQEYLQDHVELVKSKVCSNDAIK